MIGESTMEIIITPFTEDQVRSINAFQGNGSWHPFTCPKCGARLKASTVTIQCYACGKWMQSWAYRFMADWSWEKPAYYFGQWLAEYGSEEQHKEGGG
jgi:hypothetical protein